MRSQCAAVDNDIGYRVRACLSALRSLKARKNERYRSDMAKTLVSLLPASERAIARILAVEARQFSREVQFSVICNLDELDSLKMPERSRIRIYKALGVLLTQIPRDTAQVAWLVGELLGRNLEVGRSTALLVRVAKHAKHSAGRRGAIHGLGALAPRLRRAERTKVEALLVRLRTTAQNPREKASASVALMHLA